MEKRDLNCRKRADTCTECHAVCSLAYRYLFSICCLWRTAAAQTPTKTSGLLLCQRHVCRRGSEPLHAERELTLSGTRHMRDSFQSQSSGSRMKECRSSVSSLLFEMALQVPSQRKCPTANFRCWGNVEPAGRRRVEFESCSDTRVQLKEGRRMRLLLHAVQRWRGGCSSGCHWTQNLHRKTRANMAPSLFKILVLCSSDPVATKICCCHPACLKCNDM